MSLLILLLHDEIYCSRSEEAVEFVVKEVYYMLCNKYLLNGCFMRYKVFYLFLMLIAVSHGFST